MKNIPKLRFPEFDSEWDLKRLGSISEINPKSVMLPNSFTYIDLESVVKGQLVKKRVISLSNAPSRAQRLLKNNDIIFQTVRPYQGNNFFYNLKGKYVASTGYAQIRTSNIPQFLYQNLHIESFVNNVIKNCTGTSYPSINSSDLAKIKLFIPALAEQQRIAGFLSVFDEKILGLSRKKALLEDYKKGVMQKLFSQQIRFTNKNNTPFPNWKEKKLGDVAEIIGGGTPETRRVQYWKGEIIWLTPTEIKQKYIKTSKRKITKLGLKKSSAKLLPKGTLLFTSRATVGDIAISEVEVCTNQGFQSFIVNSDNDNEFLYYWILSNKKEFIRKSSGSTFLEISKKEIEKITINAPFLEEQQKIADFLTAIDQKITHATERLEKVKSFKKALLQQMFI